MMLLDCQTCPVKDTHCADCVVTALTLIPRPVEAPPPPDRWASGADAASPPARRSAGVNPSDLAGELVIQPPRELPLDRAERRAVSALVSAGLVDHEVASGARAVSEAVPYVPALVHDRRRAI